MASFHNMTGDSNLDLPDTSSALLTTMPHWEQGASPWRKDPASSFLSDEKSNVWAPEESHVPGFPARI